MSAAFFSEDVASAARRFADASLAAGAKAVEYEHPAKGPGGGRLLTSVTRLGPANPETMLVVVSGTHGIEGYAGSAIQIAALERLAGETLLPTAGVLFVHLINPWGCAWDRRENEDNVDIFRNLVYHSPPFPKNDLYAEFEEGINPREWTGPKRHRSDSIFQKLVDRCGLDGAVAVIRNGQHSHPRGVTYHGAGATWSRNLVEEIGRTHLEGVARAVVLDIHTGYGAPAQASIVPYDREGPKFEFIRRHFSDLLLLPGADPLIPSHPRPPYEIWEKNCGPQVLFVGLEFGTAEVIDMFDLFRANTFIHTYGDPSGEFGKETSARYRELFYPSSSEWRDAILRKGVGIFDRSQDLLAELDTIL